MTDDPAGSYDYEGSHESLAGQCGKFLQTHMAFEIFILDYRRHDGDPTLSCERSIEIAEGRVRLP